MPRPRNPTGCAAWPYYVAVERHGYLAITHTFGTLVDGGAFESVVVVVVVAGSTFAELFELDDLELARARFEELRPAPTRIPANAASRARDRSDDAWRAGDWAALRALRAPTSSSRTAASAPG